MKILALDLGTRTGWAVGEGVDGHRESGVQLFELRRGDSPGMRYIAFNAWLERLWGDLAPTLVVYEQTVPTTTRFAGAATRELASGFATRVQEWAARHQIEHTAVWPGTLKKFTTGKGNAKKGEMIEAARKRWAPWLRDDNETDAIALLEYARAGIVPRSEPLTPLHGKENHDG